jgi:hypothetical protein
MTIRNEPARYDSLFSIAVDSLTRNIVELTGGPFLSAGRGQFRGLWTRDFCSSAPALLELGRADVVRNQLSALIRNRRAKDSLVPRLMDSLAPAWLRVARHCALRWVPLRSRELPLGDLLLPEYRSEHGVEAIDSNLLLLLTATDYVRGSGDTAWWERHERDLVDIYGYYAPRGRGELIDQPPFSDWQDSAQRRGRTFYTNLLYQVVTERLTPLRGFGIDGQRADRIRERIEAEFFDSERGVYRSVHAHPHVSLDGNLLALDLGYLAGERGRAADLYRCLKTHELWSRNGVPGWNTVPDYPPQWISLSTRLVGLSGYHDRIRWSWLMALAAKVAFQMGDEPGAHDILSRLEQMARRDGTIHEIYFQNGPYLPWRSPLYVSEADFSWGAACVVRAVNQMRRDPLARVANAAFRQR